MGVWQRDHHRECWPCVLEPGFFNAEKIRKPLSTVVMITLSGRSRRTYTSKTFVLLSVVLYTTEPVVTCWLGLCSGCVHIFKLCFDIWSSNLCLAVKDTIRKTYIHVFFFIFSLLATQGSKKRTYPSEGNLFKGAFPNNRICVPTYSLPLSWTECYLRFVYDLYRDSYRD